MTNLEKYNNVFKDTFLIEIPVLGEGFCKTTVDSWDSVHQLNLVNSLEDAFDMMFEPEDIMAFTSYSEGKKILKKYGVEIS